MPYIWDAWYVGAFARELTEMPITRTVLGKPVVLYRGEDGGVIALGDICPHRHAPLHLGRVHGDTIACPYHGLRFDRSGACAHNPNFNNPVPSLRTPAYQTVERDGMLWLWMGDSAGDPAAIISFAETVDTDERRAVHGYLRIAAAEALITDNLLDLSHGEFLHPYLANEGFNTRMRQSVSQEGDRVRSNYIVEDEPLTPIFAALCPDKPLATADMRFLMRWDPPSCLLLEIGAKPPGGIAADGVTAWVSHLLTPETETSTHYFWVFTRDSRLDDPAFDDELQQGITQAFLIEDAPIIEWQQRYSALPSAPPLRPQLLPSDVGSARARQVVRRISGGERLQQAS